MSDFNQTIRKIKAFILKSTEADKHKLVKVCINVVTLFLILLSLIMMRTYFLKIDSPLLELITASVFDAFIISIEVMVCMQIGSYIINKSESLKLHLPYALLISIVINVCLEAYKLLKLFEVKQAISTMSLTTHTLTSVNAHILTIGIILIIYISIFAYVLKKLKQ